MNLHYLTHLGELGRTNLHPLGRRSSRELIAALDVQPGDRVLEVGCGTGETMVRLALQHQVTVTGIDPLPAMLETARRRAQVTGVSRRVRLCQVSPDKPWPFNDCVYRRAFAEGVLGFQNPESARAILSELLRVLEPGGTCVLNEAVWKHSVPDEVVAAIYTSSLNDFGLCQASEQNWSADEWLQEMQASGFRVLSACPTEQVVDHQDHSADAAQPRLVLSSLLTYSYRLKGHLSPRLIGERSTYRRLLRRHIDDGQFIEGWMFVLQKPGSPV